jgi:hypothetical protein
MRKFYVFMIAGLFSLVINNTSAQVFTSGFETWTTAAPIEPTDWFGTKTGFSVDSATQYTSLPHAGSYACKLVCRSSVAKRLTTKPLSITLTAYNISFWVKGHGSIRTGLYTGGSNNTTAYKYGSWINVNSSSWSQKTQTIISDTVSSSPEFILSVRNSLADLEDIQVDDVEITTGTIQTVSIHDIQYATTSPYASAYNGQVLITGGIVSAKYNKGMFIQGGYGPWSGLYVYDSAHIAAAGITVGDSVTIIGTVSETQTYTELKTITNVTKVSSANTLHPAFPVTLVNSYNEELEGVLVSMTNIPCVDASGSALYGEWTVYNGTDSTKIGGLLYKYTTATVGAHYNIAGVVYLGGGDAVRVEPRDVNDVQVNSVGITETKQNLISMYPNPATSQLNIVNIVGIQEIRISNILGETVHIYPVSADHIAINVSDLQNGIYFVSLLNNSMVAMTRKFVKQ